MRKNRINNAQGGFIETIILIVVTLLVMRYFDITFTEIYYWVRDLVFSVL